MFIEWKLLVIIISALVHVVNYGISNCVLKIEFNKTPYQQQIFHVTTGIGVLT